MTRHLPEFEEFVKTVEAAMDNYGDALRSIIGLPFTAGWIVWHTGYDAWWDDEGVILQFGDVSLELCCKKLSEFALAWNTVDLSSSPSWLDWDGKQLEWRRNGHASFEKVIGKVLLDVKFVSYDYELRSVDRDRPNEQTGKSITWKCLSAIEFHFVDAALILFNALDTNGLSNDLNINKGEQYQSRSVLTV